MAAVETFVASIRDFSSLTPVEQNELLLFFKTKIEGSSSATAGEINTLRQQLSLEPHRTDQQLFRGSRKRFGKPARYVKAKSGYVLQRGVFEGLSQKLTSRPSSSVVATDLKAHLEGIQDKFVREYLEETIGCFENGLFRAAIVMGWAVAFAILRKNLFEQQLSTLNASMAAWKSPKNINRIEDFEDLAERVVLDTARQAGIYSKDFHKLCVALLDQRNSFAHPSGRSVAPAIAEAFLIQVMEDVIKKVR